ncbi:MAG: choice-of-anchor J domain-containing protein [Bacteroidetes bacterium]|nr:choice-of-anchor J domain-containing protein [Bacteroidota bacterium]
MKKISFSLLLLINLTVVLSCRKKADLPPNNAIPAECGRTNIARLRAQYQLFASNTGTMTTNYRLQNDTNLYCVITADESSGNLYKTVYLRDAFGSIKMNLTSSGGLNIGDSIRINLNHAILNSYATSVQLDSIDILKRVVKINTGNKINPVKVTYGQIFTTITNPITTLDSKLVLIDSVQFAVGSKNQTFADWAGKATYNRDLCITDTSSVLLPIRTSGYSYFATNTTPCGKGSIVCIVSQYKGSPQLILRNPSDLNMSGNSAFTYNSCPYLAKDFNDQKLLSGGWSVYNRLSNLTTWAIGTKGGNYATVSNYTASVNYTADTWLISPYINITGSTNPNLSFFSVCRYNGTIPLKVYVLSNYIAGNDPISAINDSLSPTIVNNQPAWTPWVFSSKIPLNSYKSLPNLSIAFRYQGSATLGGATWQIDNIGISEPLP